MSDSRRPVIKLVLVNKADKTQKFELAAAWESDRGGYSTRWSEAYGERPGIAAIELSNGTRLETQDLWLNIYDDREQRGGDDRPRRSEQQHAQQRREAPRAPASTQSGQAQGGDDDIPF